MIGSVVVMEPNDYQAWLSGGGSSRWRRAASSCSSSLGASGAT